MNKENTQSPWTEDRTIELLQKEEATLSRFSKGRVAKFAKAFLLVSTLSTAVLAPSIGMAGEAKPGPQQGKGGGFFGQLLSSGERDAYEKRLAAGQVTSGKSGFQIASVPVKEDPRSGPSEAKMKAGKPAKALTESVASGDIGALSAKFESGSTGPSAIGYDETGGTSYGSYQIAAKQGTFKNFLSYLEGKHPDWANALREAGPADTGSTEGKCPNVWRRIAAENGKEFAAVQHNFILETFYKPTLAAIQKETGIDFSKSKPMQQVIWSTAVGHGAAGAANIFSKAVSSLAAKNEELTDTNIAKAVYEIRKGAFGTSTESVKKAVQRRLEEEHGIVKIALAQSGTTALRR